MRHDLECGGKHFDWRDGEVLGTPVPATPDRMRTLGACEHCIAARARHAPGQVLANVCPSCRQVMPLTSVCDNCG
jgi:hypothetical protein